MCRLEHPVERRQWRDLCYASHNQQTAIRELCKIAGIVLVVGRKYSSNSNRLREISHEGGVPSCLFADARERDPAW